MDVSYNTIKNKNVADFLILTVTKIETEEFLKYLKPISDQGVLTVNNENRVYTIGKIGQFRVIHTKCMNMGTLEVGSSMLVARNALNDWKCIKGVFMVGIAFGMYGDTEDDNQQHYSDVLVSSKIYPYENQKIKSGQPDYRGEWHDASTILVSAFEEIANTWKYTNLYNENVKIEVCPLLSGEKLIDDLEARNKLKAYFMEARGGEMEGIGLASACNDAQKPWILLKAICDFADGNKSSQKKEKQKDAANSACVALEALMNRDDLINSLCGDEKSSYYHYDDNNITDIVLFDNYSLTNEPFYLERKVDSQIDRITQAKGCWIFGKSGVDKTIALQRALMRTNSKYCYVVLAEFIGKSLDLIFKHIYEELCDKFEEKPDINVKELHHLSKAIGSIIDRNVDDGDFFLLIEEIPLSANGGEEFKQFVQQLCAIIISNNIKAHKTQIKYILSSISSPLGYVEECQQKVKTHIKFLEMPEWTMEECIALWKLVNKELRFELSGIGVEEFIQRMEMSPRCIKDCLRTHALWNKKSIDVESLNDL